MNGCPRRYTKRTRLIGQFHLFMSKPRFGGVFAIRISGDRMNDCPRRYTKRRRLLGQLPLFNHLRIL
ncbi:hypothetical protein D4N02_08405 [Klebsiella pneumoniae]|nr:hypothetical protein EAO26_05205 [Klebsiella pneumoniae]TXU23723.1 hypothetical protein D4N02_08405 [Klebsiella pneumoniae]